MIVLLSGVFVLSFVLVWAYSRLVSRYLFAKTSRAQSMKNSVVPSGGGLPIVLTVFPAWYLGLANAETKELFFLLAVAIIAVVSLIDDWIEIAAAPRLILHATLVGLCLAVLPTDWQIFADYIPLSIERISLGICWVWFVNLFNFMDGIDGLAGSQTVFIVTGIVIIGFYFPISVEVNSLSAFLCAGVLGFLIWNWYPSKIILGDVGSVTLGFTVGWLLIHLAYQGHLFAALVLPSYFVADASITLVRRILKKQKFWKPHREHFYQRAVLAGFKPSQVVLLIAGVNIVQLFVVMQSYDHIFISAVVAASLLGVQLLLLNYFSTSEKLTRTI